MNKNKEQYELELGSIKNNLIVKLLVLFTFVIFLIALQHFIFPTFMSMDEINRFSFFFKCGATLVSISLIFEMLIYHITKIKLKKDFNVS